ncbi:MAG: hypothetical protein ABL876_02520 [Chitinophagaceae bacterium]
MDNQKLFFQLYNAQTEDEVNKIIDDNAEIFRQENWFPYGDDENYFAVIENQQASPIPALVEKITNSIDAVLMKKCYEAGIVPNSISAPKSMDEAIAKFYPHHNWDLRQNQRHQAENIQILADGPKTQTSLIIYDDGEGQHPEKFETTFLSLLKGNKTDIHFVQGKFNMGGSGSLVFCGKQRYQLIGSKRFDNKGGFGFTLIRRHKRTKQEQEAKRHTWYEYFKIDNKIPSFTIDELDLGLHNRKFKTGTVIKLFSYRMKGITDISRDLNLSLNEFLFEPALPIFTIEKPERYPKTPQMQRELFGLKRRLDKQSDTYLDSEWNFSETYHQPGMGTIKVTVYVFKSRIEGKNSKESKAVVRREFFKNNMSVLYGLNGQIQGSDSAGFISKNLNFQLLKDHLLIHVDCTNMILDFRDELFMASRDRLKDGDESKELKALLIKNLTKSKLRELYKKRKDSLSVEGEDASDILKNIAKGLSINKNLMDLIQQTFKLDIPTKEKQKEKKSENSDTSKKEKEAEPFQPKRFPTAFRMKGSKDGNNVVKIPKGGEKVVKFETDVENHYFDRVEEPGQLKISILNFTSNEVKGSKEAGSPKEPSEMITVNETSPDNGTIKIYMNPSEDVKVGDAFEMKITLTSPGEDFDQYLIVKIVEADKPKEPKSKENDGDELSGLPPYILVYKEMKEGVKTFEDLEVNGISMDYSTVMHPQLENDKLEKIFINMDSTVLKTYKSKFRTHDQLTTADRRYITSVYFHTLMLFAISKQKKYRFMVQENGQDAEKDLTDYLKDVFESHYSSFLLNFGIEELMQNLDT